MYDGYMSKTLETLNEEQRKVVLATRGPVLVLAGAGSGKTRALTHRIAYLLEQQIARPEEILAVTFTNKAAKEMKQRVHDLLGGKWPTPRAISTFHALGVRILREQYQHGSRSKGFIVFDAQDSERLVRQVMQEQGISKKDWSPTALKHRISTAKNSWQSPSDIEARAGSLADEILARVWREYEKKIKQNDAYDFDDLLIYPVRLLQQVEEVRRFYSNLWRWLSVDEYQDTNPIQDELLRLLLGPEQNICAVGDDYQAIYSWRGANVDHILKFEKRFPGCTTVYLTQNYRSTPAILEGANLVIAENIQQKHKELWTEANSGQPVGVASLPSDHYESMFVRREIEQQVAQGGSLKDCVVLYRTNAQSRLFEEQFLTHRMPYTIVGGYRFYERREVKDALALLNFYVNPGSSLALARIAETMWKGVGRKTLEKWEKDRGDESFEVLLEKEAGRRPAVRTFVKTVRMARERKFERTSDLLKFLVMKSGYAEWLKAQVDGDERWENVEELFNVASVHAEPAEFLSEVALLSDLDTMEGEQDRVTCMTLHAAKGLEFNNVWLVGCEEGLLPHNNSLLEQRLLEEERRLMYVGMTRAKKRLVLTWAAIRYLHGARTPQTPSRFLKALEDVLAPIDVYQQDEVNQGEGSDDLIDFVPRRNFDW